CMSRLGKASRLTPSTRTRSTGDIFATSPPRSHSGSSRNSCRIAHRLADEMITSVAPAARWKNESLPGWSRSKPWWACLSVDTLMPRAMRHGISLVTRVVLPEPLQPARPIMRMAPYSKTPGLEAGRQLLSRFGSLFGGLGSRALGAWLYFFLKPQPVVLLGPIDVHGAFAHGLESTF